MLDNPQGSSLEEVVQKMQGARSAEDQDSAPIESTDEVGDEESQAEEFDGSDDKVGSDEHEEIEEAEEEAVETYRIKASGEEIDVTFDELVEGFQKGKDYYKKTMEVADERKAFDSEKASLVKQVEDKTQELNAQIEALKQLTSDQEQSIDWDDLRDSDPSEYLRQKELVESRKSALAEASQKLIAERQQRHQEALQSESQKLLTVMGDKWKDPEARQKDIEGMYDYVYASGISKEEAANIVDHRFWVTVHKAMKFDKLQNTSKEVAKQVKKAPKTIKSGQPVERSAKDADDARAKLRSSGGKDESAMVALLKANRK